jgi:hypothetical protein
MFVFFIFSGGFIGSFFALDSLEEPDPQNYAAQIKLYPTIADDCETYNACNLEGVVSVKPHDEEEDGKQILKATLQGIETKISKVSIHLTSETPSCEDSRNIGDEYFYQARTEIIDISSEATEEDHVKAYIKIDHLVADKTSLRFHYLNGEYPVIPTLRMHRDTTCNKTKSGEEFGDEFVSYDPASFSNGNLSAVVAIAESEGVPLLSYGIKKSITTETEFEVKMVKVFAATSCDGLKAVDQTFHAVSADPWTGAGDQDISVNYDSIEGNWEGSFQLKEEEFGKGWNEYRGQAIGIIDSKDRIMGCR